MMATNEGLQSRQYTQGKKCLPSRVPALQSTSAQAILGLGIGVQSTLVGYLR